MNFRATQQPARQRRNGFTLLEVILALSIAIGLLVVALYFYQQAAELRTQLLQESERLSTVRLLLDRITTDLRTAYAQPQQGFTGNATSMRFIRTDVLSRMAWMASLPGRSAPVETDLKIVSYGITTGVEGTNQVVGGITRVEQALIEKTGRKEKQKLEEVIPAPDVPAAGSNVVDSAATSKPAVEPLTDALHFVSFWYWDGAEWSETWDSPDLPRGVEVTLGAEPLPAGLDPLEYPFEIFQRVIYLPGSSEISDVLEFSAGTEGNVGRTKKEP